jgi:hypothetical protein
LPRLKSDRPSSCILDFKVLALEPGFVGKKT